MTETPVTGKSRIYVDLIGDLFHAGHLRHLEKAAALGEVLVVGIFDDETSSRLSHVPVIPMDERVAIVAALRCVDEVVPAAPAAPDPAFLDRYDIDTICLTDDFGDSGRQQALAALLDNGDGIVLPYGEDRSTAGIISTITGIAPAAPSADSGNSAIVHTANNAADAGQNDDVLDAVGALAAGFFGRSWLLNREQIGTANWMSLLRCMAGNAVQRQTHGQTDPRFVPALVSLAERCSRPGERVNLIGDAAGLVGPVLVETGRKVTVIRPSATMPLSGPTIPQAPYETVRCGWLDLADACPPADTLVVLDPAWACLLIVDPDLLFNTTLRLKRELLLCIDFWPENSSSFKPVDNRGLFTFPDTYIRNMLHDRGFFDVEDILTTVDGTPCPANATGCNRVSRNDMVETPDNKEGFIYLDGGEALPAGSGTDGKYLRWYRASKQSLRAGRR
tara:strand:+ start:20248 stop:21591 length:1344 start_codon:yes stop_codon:yes gene_type:complete